MTERVAMVALTLEESGNLINMMVGAAAACTRNPLLNPTTPADYRLCNLYKKLSNANDELMYND